MQDNIWGSTPDNFYQQGNVENDTRSVAGSLENPVLIYTPRIWQLGMKTTAASS
jgi:hypothetical protein